MLEAATALVARHGSRAASLAAVGEAAGYSRGIVNHHFGSKTRLLEALIRHTQQFDVPTGAANGLARLTQFVETYLGGLHDRMPRSEAFLKLWCESAAAEPTLAPLFAERDAAFRDLLAHYIRDGQADGSVRAGVEPDMVALTIIGALRGTAMLAISTARDIAIADVSRETAKFVERSLAP